MAENDPRAQALETGAIDVLYFPPAQHQSPKTNDEERCREHIRPVVDLMHESGVSRVFVTQCKRWSCDRRWMCEYTQLDDVLRYTYPHPDKFIGIAGYHPLDIANSLHQAEAGIRQHGFRGIFVHPASFGVSLKDRRMYPLFARATEWKVPVIVDVRQGEDGISAATAAEVEQVATDFADIKLVIACFEYTCPALERLADRCMNLHFCFDATSLSSSGIRAFLVSAGEGRCMWGSNGLPWKQSLAEIGNWAIPAAEEFLSLNAIRIFGLDHLHARVPKAFAPRSKHLARIVAE
jgi:predicted TIM-barrel fold metal-dependent hydrolase